MKKRFWTGGILAAAVAGLYLLNASWLATPPDMATKVLAHRGMYQRYARTGLTKDTCTASRMLTPTHDFLENTLPSMKAAFDYGADVVEIDIHPTTDGDFVIFHDWTVDCRTDGHGVTRQHSLAELKALDIGYGYTADGGKTFPFRGRFKGQMPSLGEVLTAFPDSAFLINFKSNDPGEADKLDAWLKAHPDARPERLSVYGGNRPVGRMHELRPAMSAASAATMKTCALPYFLLGWSGYMPKACRHTTLFLPQSLAGLAWGYPNRLQARFDAAGSYIYLAAPDKGLKGFETAEELAKVPPSWRMGILTEAIETVGLKVKKRAGK